MAPDIIECLKVSAYSISFI